MKPLRYSEQDISEDDIAAVVRALRSPYLTQGPEVERFEAALCAYTGARYAVAVSSGTAALHLAYMVAGVRPASRRGRIITSPLSFIATANAAIVAGMEVTFRDVNAVTGLLDPALGYSEIGTFWVPVHYAGRAAGIPAFDLLAGTLDRLPVIEDACHALGAMDFDGCSRVGSCAHSLATCFSFHPVKPITTGEGGAITTNDQGFAETVRMLRSHGRDKDGRMLALGWNYRMTDMQAALGTSQLERCDEMRDRRAELAGKYWVRLRELPLRAPVNAAAGGEAWHLFPVRITNNRRDEVKAKLNAQGIGAQVHYPSIHLQPYYRQRFGYEGGEFPEAEAWSAEELSLPLHSKMTEADVTRVVEALKEALT